MSNLKYFFAYETGLPEDVGYSLFDVTHWVWMIISLAITALLVFWYRKTEKKHTFLIVIAVTLISCEVIRTGWHIWLGEWRLYKSLPFQLSRIMLFVEAIAIFTDSRYLKEFCYACGLFSIAAFIAPNIIRYPVIHIHSLRYQIAHILILAVPLMWIFGDGFKPDYRYLPKISLLLFGLAGVAAILNFTLEGANYMHFHYIPDHINIRLPQPWFALAMIGAVFGFWVLSYIPWIIYGRRKSYG